MAVKAQAGDLSSYGIKAGNDNSLGCIVDNNLDTCSGFECANVSTLATNDLSFDIIAFDIEYRNTVFDGMLGSRALNCFNDNFLRLFRCSQLCLLHDILDEARSLGLRFIFQRRNQLLARFIGS